MNSKKCTKCKVEKVLEDFSKNKNCKEGRTARCKECINLESRNYRNNPIIRDKQNEQRNTRYHTVDGKEGQSRRSKKYYQKHCGTIKITHKKYKLNNRRRNCNRSVEKKRILKEKVITEYGGQCKCCGETRIEFLNVHHSFGNGKKHRKEVGQRGVYSDLKKRGFPKNEGIEILCYNCNCSLGHQGYCPHQVERVELIKVNLKYNYL